MRSLLLRGTAVWLLIIAAETVHGVARGLLFVPLVGDLRARQVGVFVGSVIIFAIAYLTIRWIRSSKPNQLLCLGVIWVVLTVVFEAGLGSVTGLSTERIVSDYDPRAGGMMAFGLLFMFFTPYLAARLRKLA